MKDIKKGKKVHLLYPDGQIVGCRNVHNDDPTNKCHGNMIREGYFSIQVKASELDNYELSIPNRVSTIMGEVVGGCMIWDTNLL